MPSTHQTNKTNKAPKIPPGKLFHAVAQADLRITRPTFAFVPEDCIQASGGLLTERYHSHRWPAINCAANHDAVGSHTLPDMNHPADPSHPDAIRFLEQLPRYIHKHLGKASKPKTPGRTPEDPSPN